MYLTLCIRKHVNKPRKPATTSDLKLQLFYFEKTQFHSTGFKSFCFLF